MLNHRNLEDFTLIWIGIDDEKFKDLYRVLSSSINEQKRFDRIEDFQNFLDDRKKIEEHLIVVVNTPILDEETFARIDSQKKVVSIFVRRVKENSLGSSRLTKKLKKSFDKLDEIIECIRGINSRRRDNLNEDLPFSFEQYQLDDSNGNSRSFNDMNPLFLHSLLIVDVLLRMKTDDRPNKELIDLFRQVYRENPSQLEFIEDFSSNYRPENALFWYTSESLLYRILNKAFRTENIEVLFYFRFFIVDLYQQLKLCQEKTVQHVYRCQIISSNELNHLRRSVNSLISIKSFFSTSLDRDVALFCLGDMGMRNTENQHVLFDIQADPNIEGVKPFGKIHRFSAFPDEKEVLFMAQSIFQIVHVSKQSDRNLTVIHLKLCGEEDNRFKDIFQQNRSNYAAGKLNQSNPMTLGNVLQRMGKFDEAEFFFRRELSRIYAPNFSDREISTVFFNMGEILREQRHFQQSLEFYQNSLKADRKYLPSNHPCIGNTLNSIGIVYENLGNHQRALKCYRENLKIALDSFGENNTRVALCLTNLGNTLCSIGNYTEALNCHCLALGIRIKALPAGHHRIGASYNNIARVYHFIGHYDLAYVRYQIARKIFEKSLPPDHSDFALVMKNLALLEENRENFFEALVCFKRELRRRQCFSSTKETDLNELNSDIQRVQMKLY